MSIFDFHVSVIDLKKNYLNVCLEKFDK